MDFLHRHNTDLGKRTAGAPLSEAEHQQRVEAAKSRWAQHLAIGAAGATLSAGAAEIVRRRLAHNALVAAQTERAKGDRTIAERTVTLDARDKHIDQVAGRGRQAIGPIRGKREKFSQVGYVGWPVPEFHRLKERQRNLDITARVKAGDQRGTAEFEAADSFKSWKDRFKGAEPPKLVPRAGANPVRRATEWTQERLEGRLTAILKAVPPDIRARFLADVKAAREAGQRAPKLSAYIDLNSLRGRKSQARASGNLSALRGKLMPLEAELRSLQNFISVTRDSIRSGKTPSGELNETVDKLRDAVGREQRLGDQARDLQAQINALQAPKGPKGITLPKGAKLNVRRGKTTANYTGTPNEPLTPRAGGFMRVQGNPDDQALDAMRHTLRDNFNPRVQAVKDNSAERAGRILARLRAARDEATARVFANMPRVGKPTLIAAGIMGALAGAGASYALSKADDGPSGNEEGFAARIARIFRQWRDNPSKINPEDLAGATEPIAYAFGVGAERQNQLFTRAAEGRGKVLIGSFGVRNPLVAQAAEDHQLKLVGEISNEQATAIKQALTDHALRGDTPEATARSIRQSIGLSPAQARHVASYRLELETGAPGSLRRALRDRRFDSTVETAVANKTPLPGAKIDQLVDAYQRRTIAFRAMTIARTEVLRASNAGAIASTRAQLEAMPDMTVIKRWHATEDARTRDTHRALDGQTVLGIDTPFLSGSTPLRWPHDVDAPAAETVNCRCTCSFELIPKDKAIQRFMAEAV